MKSILRLAFAASLLLPLACNQTPGKIISIDPDEYSTADQIKIGAAFKAEIEQNPAFEILSREDYAQAYSYLEILFNTMLQTAQIDHRLEYDWSVSIVRNDDLSTAFFLPGGHFYINTGLLKYLDSESQLLGVIGHELYYSDTDLLVKRMAEEFGGTNLGDILLDNPVENLSEMAAGMPALTFDETAVLNADEFAIETICPFLYDPMGIKTILEKDLGDSLSLVWVENRQSDVEDRMQKVENQALNCGLPGVTNEVDYQKFKVSYLP
ncbi:MAG: M48 family metalloprotease [Bacteroidota bacterium]